MSDQNTQGTRSCCCLAGAVIQEVEEPFSKVASSIPTLTKYRSVLEQDTEPELPTASYVQVGPLE